MCGIAGFNWQDRAAIGAMTQSIKHRGPDDEGFYVNGGVSLGHRRLSVIDTSSKGRQPMVFGDLAIVYNGEIYNFGELRDELKAQGYRFLSKTDTEVVLHSYHRWGTKCVNKFNGMWAFCIFDRSKNIFFMSRDRFGIKPLYYYCRDNKFIFASELKAIRKHDLDLEINIDALNFFFYQKYIGGNLTIFENCYKLGAGQNLIYGLDSGKLNKTRYYNIEQEIVKCRDISVEQRVEAIENIISEAIEKRLIADVPTGSFLSGGVDSSLISAVVSKKHKNFDTFSIGFRDKSYNELGFSKLAAKYIGSAHHYDYMDIDEDIIKGLIEKMDEPFGDASVIPTFLLSKITRRQATVVLSGDGGDEVFGGYDTYRAFKFAKYIPMRSVKLLKYCAALLPDSDKKVTLAFKIKRFVRDFGSNALERHLDWMSSFNALLRTKLLGYQYRGTESMFKSNSLNNLAALQLCDIQNYLAEDILKKVDMASMLNSLEVRVPFLDHRLAAMVLSLPGRYKIRRFKTKWLLRKIASEYLPKSIISRGKRGFTCPISTWIRKSGLIQQFLTDRKYYGHNFINYTYATELFDAHIRRSADHARQLWLIFIFNYWWYENGTGEDG